jgi:hypothetical protein
MYLLLTWSIDPAPNDPLEIEAAVRDCISTIQPQCKVIPGHVILMPSTGGDAEYEDLLDRFTSIAHAFDGQLDFALVKSRERYFAGTGFDTALAAEIIS